MNKLLPTFFSKPMNLILFNLMWIGLVIGRESLILVTIPIVAIYAYILVREGKVKIHQLLLPACIGIAIDSALTLFGIFSFSGSSLILPLWLITLWLAFATTLTQSLSFLGRNKIFSVVAGGIAFPFNYAIGERVGAVSFAEPYLLSLVIIGLIWMFVLPLLFIVTHEYFEQKFAT
ncbi:MAG: DUF2878 family protein [Pseudomonadales bacterium]|nr:DUF2878 family protein [Pseudomonadales bacterium]